MIDPNASVEESKGTFRPLILYAIGNVSQGPLS